MSGRGYVGYIAPGSPWPLTAKEVEKLEAHLPAKVAGVDVRHYVRRYTGYADGAHREVAIWFVCPDGGELAGTNSNVMGGGRCFVDATYDVQTGRLSEEHVNSAR